MANFLKIATTATSNAKYIVHQETTFDRILLGKQYERSGNVPGLWVSNHNSPSLHWCMSGKFFESLLAVALATVDYQAVGAQKRYHFPAGSGKTAGRLIYSGSQAAAENYQRLKNPQQWIKAQARKQIAKRRKFAKRAIKRRLKYA